MHSPTSVPSATALPRELRPFLDLLNQLFEVEKKVAALTEPHSIGRNLNRMKSWFEHELVATSGGQPVVFGFTYRNPLGEAYNETRTDCDASIAGSSAENLVITEVIKPIVWLSMNGQPGSIVQQAVVVVSAPAPAAEVADAPPEMEPVTATPPVPTEAAAAPATTAADTAPTAPAADPEPTNPA